MNTVATLFRSVSVLLLAGLFVAGAFAAPAAFAEGANDDELEQRTPLEVNSDYLVEMSVIGEIRSPFMGDPPYRIAPDGTARALPGTGGITYNFRVGDSAVHLSGDHIEPAVSITNFDDSAQRALNTMASIGNTARVVSGDAKGAEGTVIGKHGGIENVMVEFPDEVYDDLVIGDRIQIRAIGMGMEVTNVEQVAARNLGPSLLEALNEHGMGVENGTLHVPVTHQIPAKIMGSGLGQSHVESGDYDIQMFDEEVVERYNLNELRFGDIVAIMDADQQHGRIYRTGAVSIGVVVHGNSRIAGHGPGVTTLLTSPEGNIEPYIDSDTNLRYLLNLR